MAEKLYALKLTAAELDRLEYNQYCAAQDSDLDLDEILHAKITELGKKVKGDK